MKQTQVRTFLLYFILSFCLVHSAMATDGYFATGYGVKSQGRGGAGIAYPGDVLAAATNPAGLMYVGDRYGMALTLFRPVRYGVIDGNQLPPGYPDVNGTYDANRVMNFVVPEFGYTRKVAPNLALGVALFGNGGMNTSYKTPIPLLGTTRGGVDLDQLFVSFAVAYRVGAHQIIGLAPVVAYQRISVEGLQNFATASASIDPTHVTNTGYSNSYGAGVRVGWQGELNRILSVGATYMSRTYMSRFDRYRGLFAEGGKFDIPANFAGGVAVKPNSKTVVMFDVERILYGQIKSIANSDANQALLGASNGPGFGWKDITVIKTGMDYAVSRSLTVRGGYNYSELPISSSQTFFNLLAPAVTKHHLHLGTTVSFHGGRQMSFAYVHAFENTVYGVNSIPPAAGGGNANLRMYQNSFELSFGRAKQSQ